jgi:hypothetical protein
LLALHGIEPGGTPDLKNPGEKLSFLAGAPPANHGIATPYGTATLESTCLFNKVSQPFFSLI